MGAVQTKVELSAGGLNTLIRAIHRADYERVQWIRTATYEALKRLGVPRDKSKAVAKIPNGSDQCDLGSLKIWLDKVTPVDKPAIGQIVLLDATAVARG